MLTAIMRYALYCAFPVFFNATCVSDFEDLIHPLLLCMCSSW